MSRDVFARTAFSRPRAEAGWPPTWKHGKVGEFEDVFLPVVCYHE